MLVTVFLWISTKIKSGMFLYMVTVISIIEICIFSPIQSDNRSITEKEKHIYRKIIMFQLAIYSMLAIIADIVGKEIITVCMFLGIIITSVMQLLGANSNDDDEVKAGLMAIY